MANQATNTRTKEEARTSGSSPSSHGIHDKKDRPGSDSGGLMDKAKEAASDVMDKAKDVASAVGEQAESAASAVGGGMTSLAQTLRKNAPHEGMLGSASSTVAAGLETGGRYLQEEGLSGMVDDVAALVRRNPWPALFVGVGIGFLLAKTLRS